MKLRLINPERLSVLIAEMTRCLLKWHDKQYGVTKQILNSHVNFNSIFGKYGLVNHDSYKSESLC